MTEAPYSNPSGSKRSSSGFPVGLLLIGLAAGAAIGWWLWPEADAPKVVLTEPEPDGGVAVEEEPAVEPPPPAEVIEDLDVDRAVDEWLAVPGIVQRLAAATWRVSVGDSPTPVLGFLSFTGRFEVRDEGDDTFIAPEAYARYDAIVDRIVAVRPSEAAKVYRRLRPNFEAAFTQIAEPGQSFHDVAKSAVARILAVEVPKGPIQVVGKGATFFYADESLESLTPAEKHVIRLGPKNARRVKKWLRAVAREAELL